MISISTQVSSDYAFVLRDSHESKSRNFTRRVSRSSTLNGSSVITDSGYTDTDRTITIVTELSSDQWKKLEYMIKNYSPWNLSFHGEFFSVRPQGLRENNGKAEITMLIQGD